MADHVFRPDAPGKYVTAHADVRDDSPAFDQNYVGVTVKQKAPSADTPRADLTLIKAGERYYLQIKGEVRVAIPAGFGAVAVGGAVYIDQVANTLHAATAAGRRPFGKIAEVSPFRGVPAGFMTVDLDDKWGL